MASTAMAAPKMLKGPYLQDLAPTSITVMWEMDAEVPAKLVVMGPGLPGRERTIEVAPAHIVEARIDKLEPASRYRYKVIVGDDTWEGELRTAPPDGKEVPFTFVVYADSRIEASGVRSVGTVTETLAWADGPQVPIVSATGAAASPPPPVMAAALSPSPSPEDKGSPLWWVLGGGLLVAGAVVVVVVSLRRCARSIRRHHAGP